MPAAPGLGLVDVATHPLDRLRAEEGEALLADCRAQLAEQGFVALRGFLLPEAAEAIAAEALAIEARGDGFYSTEEHGIFLAAEEAAAAAALPATHPRRVQQSSSKRLFAADQLGQPSPLRDLYEWPPLLEFVRAALGRPDLHLSADPMGKHYLNVFGAGDQLGWHFDNSEFSVSLVLQPAHEGGAFEYAPRSRRAVEAMDAFPPAVDRALDVRSPALRSGDLYLFHGREALHRVSPVARGKRVNAILAFNSDPREVMNDYTRLKFFGRALAPAGGS